MEKIIYSSKVAGELRRRGFPIMRTDVNRKNPNYDVFVFEKTDELLEAILEITKKED